MWYFFSFLLLAYQCDGQCEQPPFQMTCWENLNLPQTNSRSNRVISNMKIEKYEMLIIFNLNYEFCSSSCCATIEILPSNLYSPALSHMMILASKHPKFPNFSEAHMWLLIVFCCEISLLQLASVQVMTSMFAKVSWDMANSCTTHRCPTNLPCLTRWFGFTFMLKASTKFKQLMSTCIVGNYQQSKFYGESSNPCFGIVIHTSSSFG